MAALTINAHVRQEKIEIKANLQPLQKTDYGYWILEINSENKNGETSRISMFLSPGHLIDIADQLQSVVGQLEAHWRAASESPREDDDSDA